MKVVSKLPDMRIKSVNYLVECTIYEYLKIALDIMHKNEFQRRRVLSKSVYALLKEDLKRGCIIPPIVLALTSELIDKDPDTETFETFVQTNKEHLVILDGLQRTYSIIDLIKEVKDGESEAEVEKILDHKIRAEFYIGLNRLGILYRMLTLNTGQTPMSLRQQIEILYLDYSQASIGDIELIREAEGRYASGFNQYNFKDIVEGFNSYLERNELPIDRADILENIRSLEKLALENQQTDIFEGYLQTFHGFISKMTELCELTEVTNEYIENYGTPFGKNVIQIFKKPQAMSGFGAAIGKLKDYGKIEGFGSIASYIKELSLESPAEFLEEVNRNLDWIKKNTKKIGNAQRSYFQYFFREVFNPENDCFQNPESAVQTALRKYQSQNV